MRVTMKETNLLKLPVVIVIHSTSSWQAVISARMDTTRFGTRFATRFPFRVVRPKGKRKLRGGTRNSSVQSSRQTTPPMKGATIDYDYDYDARSYTESILNRNSSLPYGRVVENRNLNSREEKIEWRATNESHDESDEFAQGLPVMIVIHSTSSWQAVISARMDTIGTRFATRFPFRVVRPKGSEEELETALFNHRGKPTADEGCDHRLRL